MIRQVVNSSNIASIGYDSAVQVLEIEFKDDATYQYFDVPKSQFDNLMDAGSHGQYFHQNIKDRFSYKKVY